MIIKNKIIMIIMYKKIYKVLQKKLLLLYILNF